MARIRDKGGFTLIELAIVLVIIGIILGAVIKGQDLIESAKHKKFISKVRHWETAQWAFFDRYGRFAGDDDNNGKIGGSANASVVNDLKQLANPPYEDANGNPTNTITLGSQSFYVFFGTDGGELNKGRNIMILCASSGCSEAFDEAAVEFLKALDTSIDGVVSGSSGQLRGCTGGVSIDNGTAWTAHATSSAAWADWAAGSTKAAVYWFDSKKKD